MIAWNNQVKIVPSDDNTVITINYPKNITRILKIGEFRGIKQLYMYTEKGHFLPLGNTCPKLKTQLSDDKKVATLILSVTEEGDFYNSAFKCNTVKELNDRIAELKNLITKLWDTFQKIKSSEVPNHKSKYSKKKEFKRKFDDGFGKIEIPEEIDLAISNVVIKGEHDYVKDLINLYNDGRISKGDVVYTDEFVNIINKLTNLQ